MWVWMGLHPGLDKTTEVPPGDAPVRILYVEDDDENRATTAAILGLGGLEVTEAATAVEGLELFFRGHFDIVLTDLGLPDRDGWYVVRAIKARAPMMPVVMLTGWRDGVGATLAYRLGVDEVIGKPVVPGALVERLRRLALRRRGHRGGKER